MKHLALASSETELASSWGRVCAPACFRHLLCHVPGGAVMTELDTGRQACGVTTVTENKLAILKNQTVLKLSALQRAQGFKLH